MAVRITENQITSDDSLHTAVRRRYEAGDAWQVSWLSGRLMDQRAAGALGDSPLVPSVRGDLLEQAGLHAQSSEAFTEAAKRTRNESERAVLRRRAEMNLTRAPKSP